MVSWLKKFFRLIQAVFLGQAKTNQIVLQEFLKSDFFEPSTRQLIYRASELHRLRVTDVMTPKSQVTFLNIKDSWDIHFSIMQEAAHSRYPVWGEGLLPQGVLLVKDLIPHLAQKTLPASLKDLLRPAFFVPFSRKISDLLNDFRRNRNHMALITDEHGLCVGVVTIEDILEQIVGEIEDEHDDEVVDLIQSNDLDSRTYTVPGEYSLEEFGLRFEIDFDHEGRSFDTLGGFVTHLFGYLPQKGETISYQSLVFTILETQERCIALIEIQDHRLS